VNNNNNKKNDRLNILWPKRLVVKGLAVGFLPVIQLFKCLVITGRNCHVPELKF